MLKNGLKWSKSPSQSKKKNRNDLFHADMRLWFLLCIWWNTSGNRCDLIHEWSGISGWKTVLFEGASSWKVTNQFVVADTVSKTKQNKKGQKERSLTSLPGVASDDDGTPRFNMSSHIWLPFSSDQVKELTLKCQRKSNSQEYLARKKGAVDWITVFASVRTPFL